MLKKSLKIYNDRKIYIFYFCAICREFCTLGHPQCILGHLIVYSGTHCNVFYTRTLCKVLWDTLQSILEYSLVYFGIPCIVYSGTPCSALCTRTLCCVLWDTCILGHCVECSLILRSVFQDTLLNTLGHPVVYIHSIKNVAWI